MMLKRVQTIAMINRCRIAQFPGRTLEDKINGRHGSLLYVKIQRLVIVSSLKTSLR